MLEQLSFVVSVATVAGIYAILTIGLNIHWGETGLLNFGHVAFFAVGAYASALLTIPAPAQSDPYVFGFGLPVAFGLLGAAVMAGVIAVLLGMLTLQLREDYLAMVSIGLAEIIRYVMINENWLTGGVGGLYGIKRPFSDVVPGEFYGLFYLGIVLVAVAGCYVYSRRLKTTPFGRVLRSIREDEEVAKALGKDTFRYRMQAFVVGAIMAGLAGGLWAHYATALTPTAFAASVTFLTWVALIVGGSGNAAGAVVGAVLIIGFREATRFLPDIYGLGSIIPSLRLILVGLLVMAVIRYRPEGLVPERNVSYAEYLKRVGGEN
ncbi:ABC-type transporter, integral membrane subunit [halophilic archaeon DL31]|jgi:branched-chain amino acid transport system permease protein|nr:ABC-type transporter, integral membrane subunit [halophilic archaeon DL31]